MERNKREEIIVSLTTRLVSYVERKLTENIKKKELIDLMEDWSDEFVHSEHKDFEDYSLFEEELDNLQEFILVFVCNKYKIE